MAMKFKVNDRVRFVKLVGKVIEYGVDYSHVIGKRAKITEITDRGYEVVFDNPVSLQNVFDRVISASGVRDEEIELIEVKWV